MQDVSRIRVGVAGASGKMGRLLLQAVLDDPRFTLTSIISRSHHTQLKKRFGDCECAPNLADTNRVIDLLIDFTHPTTTLEQLTICETRRIAMMIGTTGFTKQEKQNLVHSAKNIPILLAPNTSLGIAVLQHLLRQTSVLLATQTLDVEIVEAHHKKKVDAPSGTALALGHTIAEALGRNFTECANTSRTATQKSPTPDEIGFSSIRAGTIVGEHQVLLAFGDELLTLSHQALQRSIFAKGALFGAHWLAQQNGCRLFTMQDALSGNEGAFGDMMH